MRVCKSNERGGSHIHGIVLSGKMGGIHTIHTSREEAITSETKRSCHYDLDFGFLWVFALR